MVSDVVFSLSESKAGGPADKEASVAGRWLLWVDGVGGYMLLPGDDWTIGGPSGSEDSEICIQGDLSRREACIRRQGGDYVFQPLGTALLGGRRMNRPTLLRDGDSILLGAGATDTRSASLAAGGLTAGGLTVGGQTRGVRLEYCKPHPLSASARLRLDPRYKTRPRSDGIILLADTCILGPTRACHIATPLAESETVLLWRDRSWYCRGAGEILVDGESQKGRVQVAVGARVECGGLAFTLEAV